MKAQQQGRAAPTEQYTQQALGHIRHLSVVIGGRGSCTPAEHQAAEYAAREMATEGAHDVRLEAYRAAPSTYRPYALAFSAALLGTLIAWSVHGRWALALGAGLSILGVWGMWAEADFAPNWMRWLLPRAHSVNAVGRIAPSASVEHRVVLAAHLDTHRTPIFYSSRTWHTLFGVLVGGAFASMAVAAIGYVVGAVLDWGGARWVGLLAAPVEMFALTMCLHADFTSFSPGANDDASGVGVILGLAHRLREQPLLHTEVWLAFTGCEEVSAYGMAAFLDEHTVDLGQDAVYVILDQVGQGRLLFLTADGMIRKRRTHPSALDLARRAKEALPDLVVGEHVGVAYTDAAVATKRGVVALTVDALPPPGEAEAMHWHQMSDTIDHVDPESLEAAHLFAWQILQEIDQPRSTSQKGKTKNA